jgi:UPF0755 protein
MSLQREATENDDPEIESTKQNSWSLVAFFLLAVCVFGGTLSVNYLDNPTTSFPVETPVLIPEGTTTAGIAHMLKEQGLIRSHKYFLLMVRAKSHDAYIRAGLYQFPKSLTTTELIDALMTANYAEPLVTVVFPEGLRGKQMTSILEQALPDLGETNIAQKFDEHIGYAFPDTYYIESKTTLTELIELMTKTFDIKTKELWSLPMPNGLSKEEIVILASLVEREANTDESMRMVAGILLRRLELDMPLQVDATLEYLFGKQSHELSETELTFDSPYNTYEYKGLPPFPIANPGLNALNAVLNPYDTEYLYYLTDRNGTFHYARTFEEHKQNKDRYLK